ncbi:MAG: hypothetical protein KF902_01015 [Phycisphaeraceae bacterium]|nr:hypothetical protein [Phycisphaeraceae bacterium]MCW5767822.1 hypothetical protein [Phycisphaeraceae bacterium]
MVGEMKLIRATLAIVGASAVASFALAQEDPVRVVRIYDARDMLRGEDAGQTLQLSARVGDAGGGGTSPFLESVPSFERLPEKDIVLEIAAAIGLYASRVRDGIYVASGSAEAHQQLEGALGAYRGTGGSRYVVNIEAIHVVSDVLPTPGQPVGALEGARLLRSSQTVVAQSGSVIQATSSEQYVSGWVPVVGTQAVGYQAQLATAEDGFVGTLLVGALEAPEGHVSIHLAGWLLDSEVQSMVVTFSGDAMPFGVVRRRERGIQTSVMLPLGERVVLASVNGFEPNSIIVITGSATIAVEK